MNNYLKITVIWISIFFFFMFNCFVSSAHVVCLRPEGNAIVETALIASNCVTSSNIITKVASHTYPAIGDNSFSECGNLCKDIPFALAQGIVGIKNRILVNYTQLAAEYSFLKSITTVITGACIFPQLAIHNYLFHDSLRSVCLLF